MAIYEMRLGLSVSERKALLLFMQLAVIDTSDAAKVAAFREALAKAEEQLAFNEPR